MSRKFLVPLQLPANPTQPLEATPKQYVDAQVAAINEVFIGPTDPGLGASYEIWIDTST